MIVNRSYRYRKGLSLIEMAMAMGVAATFSVMTLGLIASAMQLRKNAEQMALASTLAQAKMAQLLSRPFLERTNEDGDMGNAGPYANFKYHLEIKEEQIDLAAASSEKSMAGVNDKLDAGIQNAKPTEKAGQGAATETGGIVNINRIILTIEYPSGSSGSEKLRIETFKAASSSAP